jgi:hypothetical protein
MMPTWLPDGRIQVPKRAEGPGIIGDGVEELAPGDPGYAEAEKWLLERDQPKPSAS